MLFNDGAGQKAAAQYAFDVIEYALRTFDTGPLDDFARDECVYCASVTKDVKEQRKMGYTTNWEPMLVQSLKAPPKAPDKMYHQATVVAKVQRVEVLDSSGVLVDSEEPGAVFEFNFVLFWDGAWHLDGVGLEVPKK